MNMLKPKFKIDDIVFVKDDYQFNPCNKTFTIAKILSIHIQYGYELGYNPMISKSPKKLNRILYKLSGIGLLHDEKDIKLLSESIKKNGVGGL